MRQNLVPRLFNTGGPVDNMQGAPKMNPMDVVRALQSGEIKEADLPKVGYADAMALKNELEAMAGRQQQPMRQQPQMEQQPVRRDPAMERPVERQEEMPMQEENKEGNEPAQASKIMQAANNFSAGNIKEGIRHILSSDLSIVEDDRVEGMSEMSEMDRDRVMGRLSKRKDDASMAVSMLMNGDVEDIESIVAGLEGSKYDVTDNRKVRNTRQPMAIDGEDGQMVEGIFQGPGFTLQVTGDFLVGVVNGREFVERRD